MESLLQDLRYCISTLRRIPGFTSVAILALALGIGANTAIFSVVNAIVLQPLPYSDARELVLLWETNSRKGIDRGPVSAADLLDWKDRSRSFEQLAAIKATALDLTGVDRPEQLFGGVASANLFPLLRVEAALGRLFQPGDEQPGANRVVVLSHGLWQRRFGSEHAVVGRTLTLSENSYTIIGVLPANFHPPEAIFRHREVAFWTPMIFTPNALKNRGSRSVFVIGRLKPGMTPDGARPEMAVIGQQLEQEYPQTNEGVGINLVPLHKATIGDFDLKLSLLLGVVGLVLLIVCANVANMLLARASARRKEVALRMALGATRARVIRQLLTESFLLAVGGGVLGLLLAYWGVAVLTALSPDNIPRLNEVRIDAWVFVFAFLLSLLTSTIFGLAPALHASKLDINALLKERGKQSLSGQRGEGLRSLLVVSELTLALVLLICAGLLLNSFLRLQQVNPGFNSNNLITMSISLSPKYSEPSQQAAFFQELLQRIRTTPGVESVGAITDLPLSENLSSTTMTFETGRSAQPTEEIQVSLRQVSPDYFRAMDIALLQGRDFTDRDDRNAPPVTIINETVARAFWPGEEAVGRRLKMGSAQSTSPWMTVIGVVRDVKHLGLNADEGPVVYGSYLRLSHPGMFIVARATSDPMGIIPAVQNEVWAIDKNQPIEDTRLMDQLLSRSIAESRFYSVLLSVFAGIALIITAVGVYGIVSYTVAQRTHEIGIRMALGAEPGDVIKMIMRKVMILLAIGIALGLIAAFTLTRLLSSLLYKVGVTDPATFAGVSLLLGVVALLASFVPARRATRVDPVIALRHE